MKLKLLQFIQFVKKILIYMNFFRPVIGQVFHIISLSSYKFLLTFPLGQSSVHQSDNYYFWRICEINYLKKDQDQIWSIKTPLNNLRKYFGSNKFLSSQSASTINSKEQIFGHENVVKIDLLLFILNVYNIEMNLVLGQ